MRDKCWKSSMYVLKQGVYPVQKCALWSNPPGGCSLTWPIRGLAAGQCMVFGLSFLNSV